MCLNDVRSIVFVCPRLGKLNTCFFKTSGKIAFAINDQNHKNITKRYK